jgi:hypothetical protein
MLECNHGLKELFSELDQLKKQQATNAGIKDKNKLILNKGTTELAMLRDEREKRRWLEEKMTKKESVMSKVMGH